ncbi:MAG: WG repeat-containing protein [Candidatus Obscuribacterales bacterium]
MIIIETEEDIRRAKLFNESVNARWNSVLDGRPPTPALLYFKTREPGIFEYVEIGWSKESAKTEERASSELQKLTAEDGLHDGVSIGEGYWIGVAHDEMEKFYETRGEAARIHPIDFERAVKLLKDHISHIEKNIDTKFPPIADLYFSLALIYAEHDKFEEHDTAVEYGLRLLFENLETRSRYFGYQFAKETKRLAQTYLNRDELTPALGVYARLKQARAMVPEEVSKIMFEDWNLLAEFYERHKRIDDAAACYRSIGEQIDWKDGPHSEQQENVRLAASKLIELGFDADAEKLYEKFLQFVLSKNSIRKNCKFCIIGGLICGHWFEPYIKLLQKQNRSEYASELIKEFGLDERDFRPARIEDLFGYVDLDGNWIIPQRFAKAGSFIDGKAEVVLSEDETRYARCRCIDKTGKVIGFSSQGRLDNLMPDGYRQNRPMSEGRIVVYKVSDKSKTYPISSRPELCGYADIDGNLVIEAKFTEAKPFYRGVAIVAVGGYIGLAGCVIGLQDGKYGLIDRTGKILIEPKYRALHRFNQEFDDGLMTYQTEDGGGVITTQGEVRSYLPGCNDLFYCSEGLAEVEWKNDKLPGSPLKYGFVDSAGRIAIEPQFDYAGYFVCDMAPVRIGRLYGYINRTGSVVVDTMYDDAKQFKNRLGIVCKNGRWGCIDENGKYIVEPRYDGLDWSKDNLLLAKQGEKVGLIDCSGKVLCSPQFDEIGQFLGEYAIVANQGLKGIIDRSGAVTIKPRFHDLDVFAENLARAAVKNDNGQMLWGYINPQGEFVIPPTFTEAKSFSDGLAAVRSTDCGKFGFISPEGKLAIDHRFDDAYSFRCGRSTIAVATEGGDKLFGIIDTTGKYTLPPEYEEVGTGYSEGLCFAGRKRT